jgi:hypothetical protein
MFESVCQSTRLSDGLTRLRARALSLCRCLSLSLSNAYNFFTPPRRPVRSCTHSPPPTQNTHTHTHTHTHTRTYTHTHTHIKDDDCDDVRSDDSRWMHKRDKVEVDEVSQNGHHDGFFASAAHYNFPHLHNVKQRQVSLSTQTNLCSLRSGRIRSSYSSLLCVLILLHVCVTCVS